MTQPTTDNVTLYGLLVELEGRIERQRAPEGLETVVEIAECELRAILSAARLAQKLTELLGPEPVRKAEELLGDSAALRELREDLQLFMNDNHLKFEEAANLAHSRGIELERLRERLAAAEEVCDAALEIRDGGGTLLPELLAVLKTWADREGERVARQFAELRKP